MSDVDVDAALTAHRAAVDDLIAVAHRSASAWTQPLAPGKWSPSQTVEHVARIMEESAKVIAGEPSKFPTVPWFVRPIARTFFFNRALRTNTFPKAKAAKAFDPASGPASPDAASARLKDALGKFEEACRAQAPRGSFESTIFGALQVSDYIRFQEVHCRHHAGQLRHT